jgi:allophanate hydrolase
MSAAAYRPIRLWWRCALSELSVSLDITAMRAGYAAGRLTPAGVVELVFERIAAADQAVWIHRRDRPAVLNDARALAARDPATLPLYGLPFAVKDNIDVAGLPTTAACPEFAYTPERTAFVVQRLIEAGALLIGKTNMDQFATGLVGVRSPHGVPRNPFDPRYVPGGSSSGSAVAVASGLVSFALGTDTAGSGRVPAAFTNTVGLKPSRGLLSMSGVVPACRSLDCPSIFALSAEDAAEVLAVAAGFDAADPYSRPAPAAPTALPPRLPETFRFGLPPAGQLHFFDQSDWPDLFAAAVERLISLGGQPVEIDFSPFLKTAQLLYDGPWVAERYAAVGAFLEACPDAGHPVVRRIIEGGKSIAAHQAFTAAYRLETLRRATDRIWSEIDVLVTPTTGGIYTVEAVEADPVGLNSRLGIYTNFMNLLDLAGLATPAGFDRQGLPFGISLAGPAHSEPWLLALGDALQRAAALPLGATSHRLPAAGRRNFGRPGFIACAVVGAHMEGLALHGQIAARRGRLLARTTTARAYRLFLLDRFIPARPGLLRQSDGGAAIELEVWEMPADSFGSFVAEIPTPLTIGHVELADGRWVPGFLCEPYAIGEATDITEFGGWRRWLAGK